MRKRLQNRVAESRFAFPVTMLYALAVWMAAGAISRELYLQFFLFAVSTLMMVTLNNSNALIRIYSRMVSCSFVIMTCAATFMFSSTESAVVQTCFISFYLLLFRIYQDKRAPGIAFYSFLCLGVASLYFVQILYFMPFLWILMRANLMALSHKMFIASILGIIAPYWFATGYFFYIGQPEWILEHFALLGEFSPLFCIDVIDTHRICIFAIVFLMAIVGIVHYLRNSYLDKIRTRMLFEVFVTINLLAFVFIVLQPQHFDVLLPVIIVNTSCLYAHFISLTKTRFTNATFVIISLMVFALTVFNLLY